jgi:hypothetical protein
MAVLVPGLMRRARRAAKRKTAIRKKRGASTNIQQGSARGNP